MYSQKRGFMSHEPTKKGINVSCTHKKIGFMSYVPTKKLDLCHMYSQKGGVRAGRVGVGGICESLKGRRRRREVRMKHT